jgi:tetratricopeptide (TPR) repeat protein
MDNRHFLTSALVLTGNEVHAKRDKLSLKSLGVPEIHVRTNGSEAIDFLCENPVDVVLCDNRLEDMDGVKFIRALRQRSDLRSIPVVMCTLENMRGSVLEAISAGCSGYILRPYSPDTFERHVALGRQLERFTEIEELQLRDAKDMVSMGNFDDAIEAFQEIAAMQDESLHYYEMGCKYLMESQYGKAIIAFKKAVKINDLFAEAYKGLADAYRGKGDMERYMASLQKAAEIHAQFDRLEQAKELFIEILTMDQHSVNPYNALGIKLRKQGDYPGAIHAYQQAIQLTPDDENVFYNLAKAHLLLGNSENALDSVTTSLQKNPGHEEARKLFARISGKEWHVAASAGTSTEAGSAPVDE